MSRISDFSIALQNILPDSGVLSTQKLVVKKNGKDLGEQYAVGVKVIRDEDSKITLSDKKYFWCALKTTDAAGNETWFKVDKVDLKNNLHITKRELDDVSDEADLEILIKSHARIEASLHQKLESKGITKAYHDFIKFFVCYFTVGPAVKKEVQLAIRSGQFSEVYTKKSDNILLQVKEHLKEKNANALKFFGDEMIAQIIDETIIAETNKRLVSQKETPWNDTQVQKLNELRTLLFLQKNPQEVSSSEALKKMNPLDIPLKELAAIPVTDDNLETLSEIWKQKAGNFFAKGRLDALNVEKDRRGLIRQGYYAGEYLQSYQAMPEAIKQHLNGFLSDLNKNQQLEKILDFAVLHSTNLGTIVSDDPKIQKLQAEQKIYQEKIQPLINKTIQENKFFSVASLLALYTEMDEGRSDILKLISDIKKELTEDEKLIFSEKRLNALIGREIETVAIIEYHLTSSQINNFFEYRETYNRKREEYQLFIDKLVLIKSSIEVMQLFDLKKLKGQDLLPSIFDEMYERGYTTSPLTDLDRELVILKLKAVSKQLKALENSSLNSKQTQQLTSYSQKIDSEIKIGKEYTKNIDIRNSNYQFNNENFLRGNDHLNQLFFTKAVEDEVKNGQGSTFQSKHQIALMNFTQIMDKAKLNKLKELKGLSIIPLTEEEIKSTAEFLEKIIKDPDFMKVLKSINADTSSILNDVLGNTPVFLHGIIKKIFGKPPLKINRLPAGISKNTIDFITEFNLRLQKAEKIKNDVENTLVKAENLLSKYENSPFSIRKDERLTLKELGLMSSMERLNNSRFERVKWSFFEELENLGLQNVNLREISQRAKKCSLILGKIAEMTQAEVDSHYETSDIFAYNAIKKTAWQNQSGSTEQKLTAIVSDNLTHGGKLYKEDNKIIASHLLGGVVNKTLSFYEIVVSDFWSLNLSPLIPDLMTQKMTAILGDDWNEQINDMYKSIENDLQIKWKSDDKFDDLKNNVERRYKAGAANYATLINVASNMGIKGHSRDNERGFENLYEKFTNDTVMEQKMICSEFVTKVTLVSIIELNKQLSKMVLEKLGSRFDNKLVLQNLQTAGVQISEDLADYAKEGVRHYGEKRDVTLAAEKEWRKILEGKGYDSSEIELAIRVGNQEILDLPYSRKERLKAIHPGRMISLLADKGCVTKRPLPPVVATLLDIE